MTVIHRSYFNGSQVTANGQRGNYVVDAVFSHTGIFGVRYTIFCITPDNLLAVAASIYTVIFKFNLRKSRDRVRLGLGLRVRVIW